MEREQSTAAVNMAQADSGLGFKLSPGEVEEISAHLQGCPPCLEFIESLKTTVKMCRELGVDETPAPLDAATRQKMLDAYQSMLRTRTHTQAP